MEEDTYVKVDPFPTTPAAMESPSLPPRPRKRRPPKHHEPSASSSALQNAAVGAATASIMTSALVAPRKSPLRPIVWTCAAVGLGALYLGLMYFLYRKISKLEDSLKDTIEELRRISTSIEQDLGIPDEPVPVPRPQNLKTEYEEQQQRDPVDDLAETLARFHVITKENEDEEEDNSEEEEEEPPKVQELPTPPRAASSSSSSRARGRAKKAAEAVLDLDSMS